VKRRLLRSRAGVAFALLLGTACGAAGDLPREGEVRRAASPSPAVTADASASASPDTSAGVDMLRPVPGFPGVETRPMGTARGEHVFVTRDALTSSSVAFAELWVIPLSNGADARAIVRYPGHATPWLSSRISPDGSRYALDLDRGDGTRRIAIANLANGTLRWLLSDDTNVSDQQPVWDPTGGRIAFTRDGAGVWVSNVDGSGTRRVVSLAVGGPVYVHQWTADGRQVAFYQGVGYDTVDVATGGRVHMSNVVSADASWRLASPHLVAHAYTAVSGGDEQSIFFADSSAGTRTVLAHGTAISESLGQPRWRPGADEFMYAFSDYRTERAELRVRSLAGAERILPIAGGSGTWTSDGSAIAYLRGEEVQLPGSGEGAQRALVLAEIRVIEADGTRDRLLYRTPATDGQLPPNWCVCNDAIATRRL
jgi:hypothetical protein